MLQGIIKRSISPAGSGPVQVVTPIGAKPVGVLLDGHNVPAVLFEGDSLQEGVQTVDLYVTVDAETTVPPEGEAWEWLGTIPALGSPSILSIWRLADDGI